MKEVTLDFSSAGSGSYPSFELIADGTTIVNATTLVQLESDGCVQVIVCQACGHIHCEAGGWAQARRFGDAIVWLPCFERLAQDHTEYRPGGARPRVEVSAAGGLARESPPT